MPPRRPVVMMLGRPAFFARHNRSDRTILTSGLLMRRIVQMALLLAPVFVPIHFSDSRINSAVSERRPTPYDVPRMRAAG